MFPCWMRACHCEPFPCNYRQVTKLTAPRITIIVLFDDRFEEMTPDPKEPADEDLPIFLHGGFLDAEVQRRALNQGPVAGCGLEAAIPDRDILADPSGVFHVLGVASGRQVSGVLVKDAPPSVRQRLAALCAMLDQPLEPSECLAGSDWIKALAPRPVKGVAPGLPWDAGTWERKHRDLFLAAAEDVMAHGPGGFPPSAAFGFALRRAIAAHNARYGDSTPTTGDGPAAIIDSRTRLYSGFFVAQQLQIRHRLHEGDWSPGLHREVFFTGDAVSVLPWDPDTRQLLLIRQVRAGRIARGDPDPWTLEAVAGLLDRVEDHIDAARREAREEADIELGAFEKLASYYTSPGTSTEFITSYVARCDLSAYRPGIHGLESEHEDIESLLVSEDEAEALLDKGAIDNAPLMITLLAFLRQRDTLRAAWGLPLAMNVGGT